MTHDGEASLGELVQRLRKAEGLTQEQLGQRAGYRAGAGVAISRLESGQLTPGTDRLAGIARALNVDTSVLEEFSPSRRRNDAPRGESGAVLEARRGKMHAAVDKRRARVAELSDGLFRARERADTEFLLKYGEIVERIEGHPIPIPDPSGDRSAAEAFDAVLAAITATRPDLASQWQVGALTAMLSARPWRDTATSAISRSGQSLAWTALAAAPIVALSLFEFNKRTRSYQRELAEQLERAEFEFAASEPGFHEFDRLAVRAIAQLEYIAIHAGHALNRWSASIGATVDAGIDASRDLNPDEQERLLDFGAIAAAQVAVTSLGLERLLTVREADSLKQMVIRADETLTASKETVEARV
jgi:transcriptional regulator with XRE-family HTH domain